ncbi:MAG: starch-binding protein [Paludibacteraceae bacterium]|nr:starch-binding protein [Paludibacteraceae bacterium]
MRKIYLFVALLALACFAGAANIYINNHTGWNNTRLYAWDDGRPDLIGVWPGIESSGSAAHDGVNYLRFVVPDNVFPANLIYNNGNGGNGNQLPDFRVNIAGDYYLDAWSDGMSEVSTGTQPVDDTPTDGDPLIVDNTTPAVERNPEQLAAYKELHETHKRNPQGYKKLYPNIFGFLVATFRMQLEAEQAKTESEKTPALNEAVAENRVPIIGSHKPKTKNHVTYNPFRYETNLPIHLCRARCMQPVGARLVRARSA